MKTWICMLLCIMLLSSCAQIEISASSVEPVGSVEPITPVEPIKLNADFSISGIPDSFLCQSYFDQTGTKKDLSFQQNCMASDSIGISSIEVLQILIDVFPDTVSILEFKSPDGLDRSYVAFPQYEIVTEGLPLSPDMLFVNQDESIYTISLQNNYFEYGDYYRLSFDMEKSYYFEVKWARDYFSIEGLNLSDNRSRENTCIQKITLKQMQDMYQISLTPMSEPFDYLHE